MAHRLPFHDGGCRNVHGHSYRMQIEIAGEPDKNGMVLDYFVMKQLVDPLVEQIDHAFLCDRTDELMMDFLSRSGLKSHVVDFPTTAENIAQWFFERLSDVFMPYKNLRELRVRVEETERTYAEVRGELRIAPADIRMLEHRAHMLE